jgi:hypothetical protein
MGYSGNDVMQGTLEFLDVLATRLDKWSRHSFSGSWSTSQVEIERAAAADCRRRAEAIRSMLLRGEGVRTPPAKSSADLAAVWDILPIKVSENSDDTLSPPSGPITPLFVG